MRKAMLSFAWLCAMAFVVPATSAHAANTRSWVSSAGSDTLPGTCTQAEPCLSFARAITQTNSGGEIDCATGGDFGSVTITFSITIDCGAGQVGGIGITSSGTAVDVNLSSSGVVILRNLDINGFGTSNAAGIATGATGIPGSTLIIQHCAIHGFPTGFGIYFQPTSGRGVLEVSDTAVFQNSEGIGVVPSSGVIASVVLNHDEMTANEGSGLYLTGAGTVAGTLRQSVAAENSVAGIVAATTGGVYFTVEETSVVDNLSDGIQSQHTGVNLEVGASTIGGNGTGVSVQAGAIYTFGNNQMSANATNGSFTGTTPLE